MIAIGETILIKQDGTQQILTSGIQRAYKEISYQLADEEEDKDEKMNDAKSSSDDGSVGMARHVDQSQIKSTRLRSKNYEVK